MLEEVIFGNFAVFQSFGNISFAVTACSTEVFTLLIMLWWLLIASSLAMWMPFTFK